MLMQGNCVICGQKAVTLHHCKEHSKNANKNAKKYYANTLKDLKHTRHVFGVCTTCGGAKVDRSKKECELCRYKIKLRGLKRNKHEKVNYVKLMEIENENK